MEVVRFAPSPSGPLHCGNLSTAILTWVRARHLNTEVILRMDSLDPQRSLISHQENILSCLKWAGLDFALPVYYQNPRSLHYVEGLERLKSLDMIFPCFCSRKEAYARDPHGNLVYRGTCRDLSVQKIKKLRNAGIIPSWRFKAPHQPITLEDAFRGPQIIQPEEWGGDFIVWRRDNVPGYHLASVLDDIHLGISEIHRGGDLLASSAAQTLLFKSFKSPIPNFCHFPLLLGDEDKQKLSKRNSSSRPENLFEGFKDFFQWWARFFNLPEGVQNMGQITPEQWLQAVKSDDILWKIKLGS